MFSVVNHARHGRLVATLLANTTDSCACFSTTSSHLVDFKKFFRQQRQNDEVVRADRLRATQPAGHGDIGRTPGLGPYDKAALSSIADKGMGKAQLPYNPPEDAEDKIRHIFGEVFQHTSSGAEIWGVTFQHRAEKFHFLTRCERMFQHGVPSAQLHEMSNVGDVMKFYLTPVTGVNGLTQFERMDLPKNMHVTYEPYIFHPDTDPYHNGISAFPHRSQYVDGDLKARKMYKGFQARMEWPRAVDPKPRLRSPWPNPYVERDKYS